MPDSPSLTIGRRSVKDYIVENLNVTGGTISPLRYHFIDDSLKMPGALRKHELEGEGDLLGFDVKSAGAEEGSINLQLDLPTDTAPQPGHVLKVTRGSGVIRYYGVTDGSQPSVRNNVVRVAPSLLQITNPFFKALLSEAEGDTKRSTYSIAIVTGTTTATFDPEPVNFRTGSTKAYSALQADGSALPAGFAINASTGVLTLTGASLIAGEYTIKVVCTETLTGFRTNGAEQTWIVTITA